MDSNKKYRLRVENCIGTIIDVQKRFCGGDEARDFLAQFEEMKNAIAEMDMNLIREGDVLMVENATNALLGEFKEIFEERTLGPVYSEKKC